MHNLYLINRGVETSEDDKTAGMRSKLQEEIQTLKWQEDILDKQLEVIYILLNYYLFYLTHFKFFKFLSRSLYLNI